MKKNLAWLVLLLFGILSFAFYFTKGNLLNYLLKPYLETILTQELDLKTSIQKINFSILTATLSLNDMILSERKVQMPDRKTLIHIPSLKASLQIRQLLLGKIALKKIFVDHPSLSINLKTFYVKKTFPRFFISWASVLEFKFDEIHIQEALLSLYHHDFILSNPKIDLQILSKKNKQYEVHLTSHLLKSSYQNMNAAFNRVSLDGFLSFPLKLHGKLSLQGMTFQNIFLNEFLASFSFKNNIFNIDSARVTSVLGEFDLRTEWVFKEFLKLDSATLSLNDVPFYVKTLQDKKDNQTHFQVYSKELDFKKLFPKLNADGQGSIEGALLSKDKKLSLQMALVVKNAIIENIILGDAKGGLTSNFEKTLAQFTFQHPFRKTHGKLQLSLNKEKKEPNGSGLIEFRDLSILNENFSFLSAPFVMASGIITFPRLELRKKKGTIRGFGFINKNKNIQFSFESHNLSLEEFDLLPYSFRGPLHLKAYMRGRLNNPSGTIEIMAENTHIENEKMGMSNLKAELKNRALHIASHFFDQRIVLSGVLSAKAPYFYQTSLKFSNLNFSPYLKIFHKKFLDFKSSIAGQLSAEGSCIPFPSYIKTFSLKLPDLKFSLDNISYKNTSPLSIEFKDNSFILHPFHIEGMDTSLKIQGQFNEKGNLRLLADGPFNFSLLYLFFPFIERSRGQAKISAQIDSSLLSGSFSLKNGSFKVRNFPHSFENIDGLVGFQRNKVSIQKLNGRIGGGDVNILGEFALSSPLDLRVAPKIDLHAKLTQCDFQYPLIYGPSGSVSGDLFLRGANQPYLLSGKLNVHDIYYRENMDWQPKIMLLKKEYALSKIQMDTKPSMRFNITLDAPRNIFIKNNLAQLEGKGNVRLIGNNLSPNLQGNLSLLSGSVFFKGNEFALTLADFRFNHPQFIDPQFIIHAESEVKNHKVLLNLEGTFSQYELRLSSDPPLPEADILSLLTLGGTRSEIEGQDALDITSLELGSLLFGGVQEKLQTATQKTLGVAVGVSPSFSDTKHTTVPRVFIRKNIGKKVDATFTSTLDKTTLFTDKEFNLKFNINKNLSLLGVWEDLSDEEIQENSSLGVDIKAQFEFR